MGWYLKGYCLKEFPQHQPSMHKCSPNSTYSPVLQFVFVFVGFFLSTLTSVGWNFKVVFICQTFYLLKVLFRFLPHLNCIICFHILFFKLFLYLWYYIFTGYVTYKNIFKFYIPIWRSNGALPCHTEALQFEKVPNMNCF